MTLEELSAILRDTLIPDERPEDLWVEEDLKSALVFGYRSLKTYTRGTVRIHLKDEKVIGVKVVCDLEALTPMKYGGRLPEGLTWAREKTEELQKLLCEVAA